MIFEKRPDARYFLTMDYQRPETRGDLHDPYVVLNRWRTLFVALKKFDACDEQCGTCEDCQSKEDSRREEGERLKAELERLYQEIDQLFAGINAFAEQAGAYFDQYGQLCELCEAMFCAGAHAAQAMQDSIFENPETPDTMWLRQSHCLKELVSAASLRKESTQPKEEASSVS